MPYSSTMREEEVKNRLREDYFKDYDAAPILGNVDFAVAVRADSKPSRFETEYLLWAEAKEGTRHDICESFVQLILTIGKARTFDRHLPPAFLGAFDAEKITFLPYHKVMDVFAQTDFNWNVAPSDHTTREFRQLLQLVGQTLENETLLFHYQTDDRELRRFIRQNFVAGKASVSKIRINKNNFTHIYQKWLAEVKPTIGIDWENAKRNSILDADFYLADILSEHNVTLKEKLYVLLRQDHYELDRRMDDMGLFDSKKAQFKDNQRAHTRFWNHYDRPPRREYWDFIVTNRHLLVPQDVRERKGSFFTPRRWVELSQQYIAAELGDDWQDEYTVWDCCAGTGNLLAGLTNKYNIYASTLDQADVDVMRDRIQNGANLLESHVFQFDFLNDPFTKLPQSLQEIINDPDRRKKLIIYINPPYAEAGDIRQVSGTGKNKTGVAVSSKVYAQYLSLIGIAGRELFAQFFIRIYKEIHGCVLAEFSKLKVLQAPNFREFRKHFCATLCRSFLVPANTFDNVKGAFPIGFFIWRTDEDNGSFKQTVSDVYDADGEPLGRKSLLAPPERTLTDWLISTRSRAEEKNIGYLSSGRNDFQNQNLVFIVNNKAQLPVPRGTWVTNKNMSEIAVFFAVRKVIPATWMNDRDQFLYPNDGWQTDYEFQSDCLVYTLFNNNIQSRYGVNHWIPFTEAEVDAKEKFKSHFMTDYMAGRHSSPRTSEVPTQGDLFAGDTDISPDKAPKGRDNIAYGFNHREQDASINDEKPCKGDITSYIPREHFSAEARAVMDAGRELWRYYHAQPCANPDASFYDIRLHFQGTKQTKSGKEQMNSDSADAKYTELISELRRRLKALARKIEPKVYDYGFLKR